MAHHRIAAKFRELRARNEAALIPFIVAGDPDLETTRAIVREFEARGADLIELGVPFSDPMADGPANQRALARGLGAGASLAAILSMVSELRGETEIPHRAVRLLQSDFPLRMRTAVCRRRSRRSRRNAGDRSPARRGRRAQQARARETASISSTCLRRPRRIERARKVVRSAGGFVYYVSVLGVTGARTALASDLEEQVLQPPRSDRFAHRRRLRHLDAGASGAGRAICRRGGRRQRALAPGRGQSQVAATRESGGRTGRIDEGGDESHPPRRRRSGHREVS